MRMAELVMGVVMGIFSLYLMWKSAELPIGRNPDPKPFTWTAARSSCSSSTPARSPR